MATHWRRHLRVWAAVLVLNGGTGQACGQIDRVTRQPQLQAAFDEGSIQARPAKPRRDPSLDGWPQPKRIFFPPDPPPLGARINFDLNRAILVAAPAELSAYVTEAFYAPLSTCLTDFSVGSQRKFRPRIDAYAAARDRLLAELRSVLMAHAEVPRDVRHQQITALAEQQARALEALESEEDALRAALAARAGWYDLRRWKLGAGPLAQRLPEHRALEFQVVRAAAFYQEGFVPAQRRLLREAAMRMQDEVFTDEADETVPEARIRLEFFSPDLARVLPVADLPPVVAEKFAAFVAEKDRLRQELTESVIAEDKARFSSNRRRAFVRLARAQAVRLAALDEQAEAIRREYAPTFARRRLQRPDALPTPVVAEIDRYLSERNRLIRSFEKQAATAVDRMIQTMGGASPAEVRERALAARAALGAQFEASHAAEMRRLQQQVEKIYGLLVDSVGEEAVAATGPTGDSFITEFLGRYRCAWSYYEYEMAVFEPGLSPAQRRLLLGGAVRWLELPLPRPEFQPMALPLTLLKDSNG